MSSRWGMAWNSRMPRVRPQKVMKYARHDWMRRVNAATKTPIQSAVLGTNESSIWPAHACISRCPQSLRNCVAVAATDAWGSSWGRYWLAVTVCRPSNCSRWMAHYLCHICVEPMRQTQAPLSSEAWLLMTSLASPLDTIYHAHWRVCSRFILLWMTEHRTLSPASWIKTWTPIMSKVGWSSIMHHLPLLLWLRKFHNLD